MTRPLELLVNLWIFGAPVVLMLWALLRLLARVPARVRYVIAIAGLLVSLALPLLATFLGRNPLVPHSSPAGGSMVAAVPAPEATAPLLPRELALYVARLLAAAWAGGALLLLVRDAAGHVRLRRLRLAADHAPEGLERALQWPAAVPLLIGDCHSPCTFGLVRPAVLLPADITRRYPVSVVERMARHELSHARWRDPLMHALLRALAALFWMTPVWLALRWVRREREVAADESALAGTRGSEAEYVRLLLSLSRKAPAGGRGLAAGVSASDLEYRARCILAPRTTFSAAGLRYENLYWILLVAGASLASVASPARIGAESITPLPAVRAIVPPSAVPSEPSSLRGEGDRGPLALRTKQESLEALEITRGLNSVAGLARDNTALMIESQRALINDPPSSTLEVTPPPAAGEATPNESVHRHADVDRHDDGQRIVDATRIVDRRVAADKVVRVVVKDSDDMPPPRVKAFLNRVAESFRGRDPAKR